MIWLKWLIVSIGAAIAVTLILGAYGAARWQKSSAQLLTQLEAQRAPAAVPRFNVREIEGLPEPVRRYFRAVLKDGQPIIAAASIEMTGTINMSAGGESWKPFTSTQRVVTRSPGFVWDGAVMMYPGVPARVVDRYSDGEGLLNAKLLGLFTVANTRGGGELARGEFMRWFAETPWYPTALLPSQGVRWQAINSTRANATINDGHLSSTLLFRFDDAGLIASVSAEARGAGVGKDMVMLPWECTFSNYQPQDGMLIPMAGEASYIRPEGRASYFVGKVKTARYEFEP